MKYELRSEVLQDLINRFTLQLKNTIGADDVSYTLPELGAAFILAGTVLLSTAMPKPDQKSALAFMLDITQELQEVESKGLLYTVREEPTDGRREPDPQAN